MASSSVFRPVPSELDFPAYEHAILEFWKERAVVEASLRGRGPEAPHFVFYEGPPTANGVPHNGHVLTRVIKDLFPRYHAMTGANVLRKGGWDTHGLPVEVEVEKELRIHGKAAIEEYGVRPFVARCIESVFRYTAEWERLTERIGFWVSLKEAYVTYHRSYVESVWWALSELFQKGLLYQGHKVVWWWAQGGTALSAAEVGLGYKMVDDPSVYVAFPLVDDPKTALAVWTTTPWTLLSNGYAAVRASYDYDLVRLGEPLGTKPAKSGKSLGDIQVEQLIVASELRPLLEQKLGHKLEVVRTCPGSELVGLRYRPPFDVYSRRLGEARVSLKDGGEDSLWWRVIAEDFVTLDAGTGIVHIAPAFGEDDSRAHQRQLARYARPEDVELLCAVSPDGKFRSEAGVYAGRWVKDADSDILRELAGRKLLVFEELYRHDYPFCWRADEDPLIQMARPAWFIRTTARLGDALDNNQAVSWLPEHIQQGRFGDFLRNNVDWALSRERYWGTPLNVWKCTGCGALRAPASVAEIEHDNPHAFDHFYQARREDPSLSEHLIVHKPWIDEVVLPCAACRGEMRRVPEVIDCWFDSGCMPFAQWGFPHVAGSRERFFGAFPADFISEAIDQTRGWFYSLLMISSLVFDQETQARLGLEPPRSFPHPFKTCIVLGHVCDREGRKESKAKGNYTPPDVILDRVRMDFGVLAQAPGIAPKPGEALIASEDLDGMDLADGALVAAYRRDRPAERLALVVRASKRLPRRVVLLGAEEQKKLAVVPIGSGLGTLPVEVPRAPVAERVTLEDETTPAPGADAFRWFFYASSPPWTNTRHSLKNVRTLQRDFQVKLRNVYSFFVIYANIDGWRPELSAQARPPAERQVLDRWMVSETHLGIRDVRTALDAYLVYDAAARLVALVEGLSNWYVRRSRSRFWAPGLEQDKLDAYATLYDVLTTLARLAAPFIPFFTEEMYQNLAVGAGVAGPPSVHLADYPLADESAIDRGLAEDMAAVREIVSLGLGVRTASKQKVRQPLSRADVVFNQSELLPRIGAYRESIREELNVHELRFMALSHEEGAVTFRIKPNFRALGPRLGKNVQAVKQALERADGSRLHHELFQAGKIRLELGTDTIELGPDEVEVLVEARPGFAAETGKVGVVVLNTTLTEDLVDEGILREVLSRVQNTRKELALDFTDRIVLTLGGSERLLRICRANAAHLGRECLASQVDFIAPDGAKEHRVGDETLLLEVVKARG